MASNRQTSCARRFARIPIGFSLALMVGLGLDGQVAEKQARRTFTHEGDVETATIWQELPRWDGEMLVGYTNNLSSGPIIYTIDKLGRRDDILFTLQNAAQITILNIAASSKGEIAIVGSALTADTRSATFLARIAADRKQQVITRTWPYCPMVVAFVPDGTLWTIGNLKNYEKTRDLAYHVLRRFDREGKMLGSTTIRARGANGGEEVSLLHASRDRVGWYTADGEYIEFTFDGTEIARYDGPDGADWQDSSMALSDDNDVILGRFGKGRAEFAVLDRERRAWIPVSLPKEYSPSWARVLGFDGTTLVTATGNGRLRRFSTK